MERRRELGTVLAEIEGMGDGALLGDGDPLNLHAAALYRRFRQIQRCNSGAPLDCRERKSSGEDEAVWVHGLRR